MKILGLSRLGLVPYEDPSGYGGRAFQRPVEALVRMGCEVKMIAPVPRAPFPLYHAKNSWKQYAGVAHAEVIESVEVFHPRYISFPMALLMQHAGFFMYNGIKSCVSKLYKLFPFDIIHAHNVIPEGYAAMLLANIYHKPIVVTARGTDIDIISKQSIKCLNAIKEVLEFSRAVVAPSPRLAKSVNEIFSVPVTTICNGLDLDEVYTKGNNKSYNKQLVDCSIIVSVSELTQSKGIDLNIRAVRELVNQGRNVYYVIVGDGPFRNHLEGLVFQLQLENYVEFVGAVSHEDAMGYISTCDIFSMPSWQETFGLTYLEAMAHAKPVIGCHGQGMDSIITENKVGLLAQPLNVESLVDAFSCLIDNVEDAKKMGKRGQDLVINKFTHTVNATQTKKLYEDIILDSIK